MEGEPPPVEERRRLQQELSGFVESCCRTLEEVTASLGWSLDRLDPGEEAAEVNGGLRSGSFWGPSACGLLWRGRNPRGSPCPSAEPWWAPGTRPRAPLTPTGLGWGARGAFGALGARRLCGAPSAELRFEEKVKLRWVRRGGRSGVYLENR